MTKRAATEALLYALTQSYCRSQKKPAEMDIEFHYYIVYLIAARAGFEPSAAYKIAYSSQFVDNNVIGYEFNPGTPDAFKNYISQTYNILKPNNKLFRIYPLFHFIPGNIREADSRKDGKLHYLTTTPGSENARKILDAAVTSKNLYRIGIACHAYADTWAHQNFVGYLEGFNARQTRPKTWFSKLFKYSWGWSITGHAAFKHSPDRVNKVWRDQRLISSREERDNNVIFREAAGSMFEVLWKAKHPNGSDEDMKTEKESLLNDIGNAMSAESSEQRIKKYMALSEQEAYGREKLKEYDSYKWMTEATHENLRALKSKGKHIIIKILLTWFCNTISFFNKYTWKDSGEYKETDWFQFQEAVKEHQKKAAAILNETEVGQLEPVNW